MLDEVAEKVSVGRRLIDRYFGSYKIENEEPMYMLSRIADSLYWLHRYMERADGVILNLRNTYILSFDKDLYDNLGYKPMLQTFTMADEDTIAQLEKDKHRLLYYMVADSNNINSMRKLVGRARENARGSQDKITKELWEQVNGMYHYLRSPEMEARLHEPAAMQCLDYLQQQTLLYNGVVDSTMPRGLGWSFMNIGKYIERCLTAVNLTAHFLEPIAYNLEGPEDLIYWRRLLLSLSGYELYLKSNRREAHSRQVVAQVIFNKDFPRSVLYSLIRIEKYLNDIAEDNPIREALLLQKQFARLRSMIEYADVSAIDSQNLKQTLESVQSQIWDFGDALARLFFQYT